MSNRLLRATLPAAFCVPFVACADTRNEQRYELSEIADHHSLALAQYGAERAEFARHYSTPQRLEFPGVGTIIVHECSLEGLLGHESVRVHFTWINSTHRVMRGATIRVVIRDPRDGTEWAMDSALHAPPTLPFGPDCTFTTQMTVPTHGVHLAPGWEWRIEATEIPVGSIAPSTGRRRVALRA